MWWKNVLACLPGIETVGSRSVDTQELQITLGIVFGSGCVSWCRWNENTRYR